MSTQDNNEFKHALRDIAAHAPNLRNPYDRVRCSEWVRYLNMQPDDNLETSKLRNTYAQLLRVHVRNAFLHEPFTRPPPEGSIGIAPLAEVLGKLMTKHIPYLPKAGPIAPMVQHKSEDGRAYIAVKQIPNGGVFCYMAVSPDGF